MLETELTLEQRMALCQLISNRTTHNIHGRDYQYPSDDIRNAVFFDEAYLRMHNNKIAILLSDAQLVSIVQQLLDKAGNDVVEITAVLTELDSTEQEAS